MVNIFKYVSLAIDIGAAVASVTALVHAHKKITGHEISAAVDPAVSALKAVWPEASKFLPPELVADVAQTTADALNKYVLHIS
jgi:hypothetical protein